MKKNVTAPWITSNKTMKIKCHHYHIGSCFIFMWTGFSLPMFNLSFHVLQTSLHLISISPLQVFIVLSQLFNKLILRGLSKCASKKKL
uniref:Uncharacterized protein n=1 Tax=Octopus bimaculoides TaxID=37653 RepID=A0A0L8GAI1_OCTBM